MKPRREAFTFQYTKNTPNRWIKVKSKLSLRHLLQQHETEDKPPAERTNTTNTSEWKETKSVAAPADTATNTRVKLCTHQHKVYQWMEGNAKFIAVPADTATNTKEKICGHQHNELTGKTRTAPPSLNGCRHSLRHLHPYSDFHWLWNHRDTEPAGTAVQRPLSYSIIVILSRCLFHR